MTFHNTFTKSFHLIYIQYRKLHTMEIFYMILTFTWYNLENITILPQTPFASYFSLEPPRYASQNLEKGRENRLKILHQISIFFIITHPVVSTDTQSHIFSNDRKIKFYTKKKTKNNVNCCYFFVLLNKFLYNFVLYLWLCRNRFRNRGRISSKIIFATILTNAFNGWVQKLVVYSH